MPFNKSEYDQEYAKKHIVRKFIPFNDRIPDDLAMLKYLATKPNVTAYIKKLIQLDMQFDVSDCDS